MRFVKDPSGRVYKPVVGREIDTEVIKNLLQEGQAGAAHKLVFPEDWAIWREDGYLVCEKYTRNEEAIHCIVGLVQRARCEIYDVGAHCGITLDEWLAAIRS